MRSSYGNTLKALATRLIRLFFQLTLTAVIMLVLLSIFAFLRIQAGPISHPRIVDFIEDRINQRLQGGRLEIGSIALSTDSGFVQSKIVLSDIILHGDTQTLARLPMAAIDLANGDVLQGQFRPLALRLTGLSVQVVRDKNGVFNFQMDSGADANRMEIASIDAALVAFNNIAALARLDEITLRGAVIDYRDLRTEQALSFEQVDLRLSRATDIFNARLSLSLQGDDTTSQISMDITHRLGETFSAAEVSFDNIHLAALSEQIGELNIPQALPMRESPLSGRLSFDLNEAGIDNFIGAIETGARFTPTEQTDNSRVYFTYSGRDNAFNISRLDLRLPFGLLRGGGQIALVYGLLDAKDTLQTISADLKIDQILLEESVGIESALLLKDGAIRGAFDVERNRFDLFEGRIVTDQTDVLLSGAHWKDAGDAGDWQGAYNFSSNAISIGDFLRLWPVGVKRQARDWMQRQIRRGTITSLLGELEIVGDAPQFQIDFMFRDLDIEYVAGLPILREARGTGVLTHRALDMSLARGFAMTADGGRIELAGSRFTIPDLTIPRRAPGVFNLRAVGSVRSALNLLDVEKFQFLSRIGLGTDIGQGRVEAVGTLTLPLANKITTADIALDFDGHVRDFYSDNMFVGYEITAQDIEFTATHQGITMAGAAALDGIAARGVWQMDFAPRARGGEAVDDTREDAGEDTEGAKSYLDVDFTLNAQNMERFGVTLPDGYVEGETPAKINLTFEKGERIAYQMTSELVGMTLAIESLGWTKPPEQTGNLSLTGFLSEPFSVDNITFNAGELQATGRVTISANGEFERLALDKFTLGDTLDTSLELIAATPQSPQRIVTRGGTADLRKLNFARMAEPSDEVLELAFDTFQITDTIALTNFTARLADEGASHGTFGGQVNGAAGVTGTLGKSQHGARIDVQTQDAGGLLESAGLLNGAVQGTGGFSLIPQEQTGFYSGSFEINDGRLSTTNPLIDLVNSVSILGLVQQLEGQGVHFEQSEGSFTLQPNGVVLHELSAIGASVGVSMSGVYDADAGMVDFDGEFTPLYALNGLFEGIFGQLSARNKGGGLFGFTYTVKGGFDEPKVEVNPVSILAPGLLRRIFQPQNAPSLDAPQEPLKLSPNMVIPEQNR